MSFDRSVKRHCSIEILSHAKCDLFTVHTKGQNNASSYNHGQVMDTLATLATLAFIVMDTLATLAVIVMDTLATLAFIVMDTLATLIVIIIDTLDIK